MISSGLVRESRRPSECVSEFEKMFESKLGVVNGESLAEDMEGCGDELVLKRVCAPGGEGPKEKVEIIRSDNTATSSAIAGDRATLGAQVLCLRGV
jgi:hypothetical protein